MDWIVTLVHIMMERARDFTNLKFSFKSFRYIEAGNACLGYQTSLLLFGVKYIQIVHLLVLARVSISTKHKPHFSN